MTMHQRWQDDADAGMQPFQQVTPTNPEMARKYEEAARMFAITRDRKYLKIFRDNSKEDSDA